MTLKASFVFLYLHRMLSDQDITEIRALTIRDVILRVFPSLNGSTDLGESLFVWSFG